MPLEALEPEPIEQKGLEPQKTRRRSEQHWIFEVLLLLILVVGGYFRLIGVDWDEHNYLHPDERFLIMVESSIEPVGSLSEYFDTAISSLNPHNRDYGFFVYGTWPIFIVRYIAEWVGKTGYGDLYQVGRPISAISGLLTVYLVYLTASRLYDRRVGLLSAAFLSFSVLHIQLSHFFKEDTFMTLFTMLTLYFAARVAKSDPVPSSNPESEDLQDGTGAETRQTPTVVKAPGQVLNIDRDLLNFLLFGVALGMAVSSKLNAAPVGFVILAAVWAQMEVTPYNERPKRFYKLLGYMVLAGGVSLVTFRILQPYAFSGPGFFDIKPNPAWVDNLRALQGQANPDSIFAFPPSLQWAERPIWFSLQNMVLWGFGLPLGLLAWAGFLWAGWRMFRGERQAHLVLWFWTGSYFVWQSSIFNPTMRYQLPIYPTLVIFAGWAAVTIWDKRPVSFSVSRFKISPSQWRVFTFLVVGGALAGTFLWAFAFSRIYTRDVTRVAASRWIFENVPGPINLQIQRTGGAVQKPIRFQEGYVLSASEPYRTSFEVANDSLLSGISFHRPVQEKGSSIESTLRVSILDNQNEGLVLERSTLSLNFPVGTRPGAREVLLPFESPLPLIEGRTYELEVEVLSPSDAAITFTGAVLANETSWDDGLPLRLDGYDPYGGIYQGGLNFEMYWEDNQEKRERFVNTMEDADYILITSSRQWASTTRVPERYPMTTAYYRALVGCPESLSIERCYNTVEVGDYQGELGFELIKVFQSDPNIGSFRINDQFSEEAFTVYDHPKVFIFQKTDTYDQTATWAFFESQPVAQVDGDIPSEPALEKDLLLPEDQFSEQLSAGTWGQLFDTDGWVNRYQPLTVVIWYLGVALMGLVFYPVSRLVLPGLSDRGYPLARTAGLLVLSYLVWLSGSINTPFRSLTVSIFIGIMVVVAIILVILQREELRDEIRRRRWYFLVVEGLFLAFFVVGLLIRLGNPDLWHPWKGGEKPMDFSYFNAVLKSNSFPPYDPWFAGGYINYYYYGFLFVGVLVKWLGIVPAVAYNLILPTLLALIAMGAFSIGWNIFKVVEGDERTTDSEFTQNAGNGTVVDEPDAGPDSNEPVDHQNWVSPWITGGAAAIGVAFLGNLGTLRMIMRGYQRLAATGGDIDSVGLITRAVWTFKGFVMALAGAALPYSLGDWYWIPSRAIPAPNDVEPITEFPFFTFLYADLHAHLIALPLALLAIAWSLSILFLGNRWWNIRVLFGGLVLGSLTIGALRPTNTWDFYPYLALGSTAVVVSIWLNFKARSEYLNSNPILFGATRVLVALLGASLLVGLSHLLFQPYARWYGQGYNAVEIWTGTHTPVGAYLTHWGLFLFVIVAWMAWETREWMANTPLSSLRKLESYKVMIQIAVLLLVVAIGVLLWMGVNIAWLVFPLAFWAGTLLLRPGLPLAKRAVLFLFGTALILTLMVEVIVLQGDIGRMNTVFKFYLQVWTLIAICAAGAFGWVLKDLEEWSFRWRSVWQLGVVFLVAAAFLYPLIGSAAKIRDRISSNVPHTLDGMAFMQSATYNDQGVDLDLREDYQAIRWMQENIQGSPIIVEANTVEYRWGTRYTIYTGLPGVVGWNWHQRQQRAILASNLVTDRVEEIREFYNTTDAQEATGFVHKYGVDYIIVGQLERLYYPGPGLSKFENLEGELWREVYRNSETVIYQVTS